MLPDGFEQLELFPPEQKKKKPPKKTTTPKKTMKLTKKEIEIIKGILEVVYRVQETGGDRTEIKTAALWYLQEILGVPELKAVRLSEPLVNFCFADPYWLMEWILRELDPVVYKKYKYLEKKEGEKHGSTRSIRDTRTTEAKEGETKTEEKVIQMFVRPGS